MRCGMLLTALCVGQDYKTHGVHEFTVTVPIKPPLLATIKSNNYLLNALTCACDRSG